MFVGAKGTFDIIKTEKAKHKVVNIVENDYNSCWIPHLTISNHQSQNLLLNSDNYHNRFDFGMQELWFLICFYFEHIK